MPQVKITTVNVVKESDVPTTVKNTVYNQVANELLAQVNKLVRGQAISFTAQGAGKRFRAGLQRKFKSMELGVVVRQKGETFFVVRPSSK